MANDFLKKKLGSIVHAAEDAASHVAGAVEHGVADVLDKFKRDKEVIVYPTYGYRKSGEEGTWVLRLRIWVSKARRLPISDEVFGIFASDMGRLSAQDVARLRLRIKHFVADDDSRETVQIKFDDDPDEQTYTLPGTTDFNGLLMQDLEIHDAKARKLLAAQGSSSGWLNFKAIAEGFEGKGRIRLVEPKGLSIISDIDDTIKITEVPAGNQIVLRNTFLHDYLPTADMAKKYKDFGDDVMFHYVSGSPWQLYKLLGEFVGGIYPEGAFHMKDVRKNLLSADSWHDFKNFASGDMATFNQKVEQITRIMQNLPDRDFILIGDSGEQDPKVFSQMKELFSTRVREIIIRDVVDEEHTPESRLGGMTIIKAPKIVHGVTQFKD
jgi:phosphatidate phosphatase APP1